VPAHAISRLEDISHVLRHGSIADQIGTRLELSTSLFIKFHLELDLLWAALEILGIVVPATMMSAKEPEISSENWSTTFYGCLRLGTHWPILLFTSISSSEEIEFWHPCVMGYQLGPLWKTGRLDGGRSPSIYRCGTRRKAQEPSSTHLQTFLRSTCRTSASHAFCPTSSWNSSVVTTSGSLKCVQWYNPTTEPRYID
jgi:hypothetical protein